MAENNIKKLLRELVTPIQVLEQTLQSLLTDRSVTTAEGEQLDVIGRVVGQERGGMVDDDYRRIIRARISVNRSKGTVADVIGVADLVVYDDDATYYIHTTSNASFIIEVEGVIVDEDTAEILRGMLVDTVAAGVRFELITYRSAPAGIFRFDSGPGWDQGKLAAGVDNS
jgi:hypothetical protein